MALSKNINQYADVAAVLNAALTQLPARLELGSEKESVYWRQRAYHFRKLLSYAKGSLRPQTTPYDHLLLRVDGEAVVIEAREVGTLTGPDGKKIEISPIDLSAPDPVADDDDLVAVATELLKEKGEG